MDEQVAARAPQESVDRPLGIIQTVKLFLVDPVALGTLVSSARGNDAAGYALLATLVAAPFEPIGYVVSGVYPRETLAWGVSSAMLTRPILMLGVCAIIGGLFFAVSRILGGNGHYTQAFSAFAYTGGSIALLSVPTHFLPSLHPWVGLTAVLTSILVFAAALVSRQWKVLRSVATVGFGLSVGRSRIAASTPYLTALALLGVVIYLGIRLAAGAV